MLETLHLLFVLFCLSQGSAGSFFNLKAWPGLVWNARYRLSLSPSAQTLLLSTLLPVRQSARDGGETPRIIIPIHSLHFIDTKPCTDSASTSPLIASVARICGAKSRVGFLIPISPIISRVYWYMKLPPGNKPGTSSLWK